MDIQVNSPSEIKTRVNVHDSWDFLLAYQQTEVLDFQPCAVDDFSHWLLPVLA